MPLLMLLLVAESQISPVLGSAICHRGETVECDQAFHHTRAICPLPGLFNQQLFYWIRGIPLTHVRERYYNSRSKSESTHYVKVSTMTVKWGLCRRRCNEGTSTECPNMPGRRLTEARQCRHNSGVVL